MEHIRDEIRIEAPVEHVWSYMVDGSHWDEIQPRAKHTDFSGPLDQVGTTFVQTGRMMGFESKTTLTVVEVEPQRLFRVRGEPGPWEMTWRLEPDGDATRLVLESDYEMPGHAARVRQEPHDQELDGRERAQGPRGHQGVHRGDGSRPRLRYP